VGCTIDQLLIWFNRGWWPDDHLSRSETLIATILCEVLPEGRALINNSEGQGPSTVWTKRRGRLFRDSPL